MGWMTWNMFGGDINGFLLREMADAMVASGMADAEYEYIIIDDLWQGERDSSGVLQPDPAKFPRGMKSLADYVHERGLKLGIYSDAAVHTCAGATGSYGYEEVDARTWAVWGIDYVKYDYCGAPAAADLAFIRYKRMSDALKATGRPILFAVCEWGVRKPWLWAADAGGHIWRMSWDIRDTWDHGRFDAGHAGIVNILDRMPGLEACAGPGRWNDPDMLVAGLQGRGQSSNANGAAGCSVTEYEAQMSLWCLLSAPLIASCDLRNMDADTKRILTNPEAIAIDQDPLGRQAARVYQADGIEVWKKALIDDETAIGVLNRADTAREVTLSWRDLALSGIQKIRDVWLHRRLGITDSVYTLTVQPHQVRLLVLEPDPE
ncbi:glycoside hydrolase family 27 protein [bacterium]|nr:glycoside hydrolase family 27 protein [bacterium]